jgi:hypothetical protein
MVNDCGKVEVKLIHTLGPFFHREASVGCASAGGVGVKIAVICLRSIIELVERLKIALNYFMRVLGVGATRRCLNIFGSMNGYGRHLPHKGGIAVERAIFDIKTIALAVIRDSGLAQVSVIEKAAIIYVKRTIIVCEMAKDGGIGGAASVDEGAIINI